MTLTNHKIETTENTVYDITDAISGSIVDSGIESGLCLVFIPHTTGSLSITSYHDPMGFEDLHDEINRLVPTRIDFKHQHDTPQDAAGHVKSVLIGVSLHLIIDAGKPLLGHSQRVYFNEFDGPRKRQFFVKCTHD